MTVFWLKPRARPRARSLSALALAGALLFPAHAVIAQEGLDPAPATAQATPFTGRVLLDGRPVAGSRVTLHRVAAESSGAIDSVTTDATGTFSFPRDAGDGASLSLHFATANHQSVTFFGPLVRADQPTDGYTIAVYDTASTLAQPVRITTRNMLLLWQVNGAWEVEEAIQILNPTDFALVSRGQAPPWSFRVPPGATAFEAGFGDVLPHELALMEDRVIHLTPVIPGQRQMLVRYRLPPGENSTRLLLTQPTDTFNLFIRQPAPVTGVTGLQPMRTLESDGMQFLQYGGTNLAPGTEIELRWTPPGGPVDPVTAAVVVTVLVLAAASVFALRQRRPAAR